MITKQFITAGEAIFTVVPPAAFVAARNQLGEQWHEHYTFRVSKVELKASADGKFPARTAFFIASLTGQDNTSDYTYLGELKDGVVKLTKKSAFPETATRVIVARRVLAAIFAGNADKIAAAGWEVKHEGYCGRCGKLLTVPESIDSGFGPECIKQVMGCTLGQFAKSQKAAVETIAKLVG